MGAGDTSWSRKSWEGPGGPAAALADLLPETEWQDEPQQLELFDRDDSSV